MLSHPQDLLGGRFLLFLGFKGKTWGWTDSPGLEGGAALVGLLLPGSGSSR